jgi:hypothetical protein
MTPANPENAPHRGGLLRLLLTLLLVLPIVAEGNDGGGDGGVINLPNARWNNSRTNACRVQVTRDDFREGVLMRLPTEMKAAVAVLTYENQVVPVAIVEGRLCLDGASLEELRAASVYRFDLTILDEHMCSILVTIEMSPDNSRVTIKIW